MPKYIYYALDQNGNKITGDLFADSQTSIFTELKQKNLFPISIEEFDEEFHNKKELRKRQFLAPKITKKQISNFFRQFSSMYKSGMLILTILDVLTKEEENITLKYILEEIKSDIMKGDTLSIAMSKHKIFPQIAISMAEVGEANGKLDMSLLKVSKSMDNTLKLQGKIKSAMIYPSVLLTITILACTMLTIFVLPVFAKLFEQSGTPLPPLTRLLLSISTFLTTQWYIVLLLIFFITFLIIYCFKNEKFRVTIDKHMLRIPVIGRLQKITYMSTFCRVLSSLLEGGVEVIKSLEIVKNVISNTYMKNCLEELISDVKKGISISQSINKFDIFTPLVVSSIKIAEESGSIGEVLERTSDIYEEDSEIQLQKLVTLLEPAVTIIMALGVGVIVISIIQPMFQMYTIIGK